MSRFRDEEIKQAETFCNACGKKLKMEHGLLLEDAFEAKKDWGFFSNKDLEQHRFILCEACYDHITGQFKIPVEIEQKKEVL